MTARWGLGVGLLILLTGCQSGFVPGGGGNFNVRSFGARGNGTHLDTAAINNAIAAANHAGGGTVYFPAGTYLCFSIHLKSNVSIYLDQGATILAADSPLDERQPGYDPPEPCPWDAYQDFGHSHWHNSLIWGENLENIAILGPGRIDGKGLTRGGNPRRPTTRPTAAPTTLPDLDFPEEGYPALIAGATTEPATVPAEPPATTYPSTRDSLPDGIGNKAIALKWCRNVILKDFTIYRGGHFGILATGVDNFTIDNLKIDTNRDGIDIDACWNVRVSNCTVNSPSDDAICLKSSYGLGVARATENVTITNCQVSGYETGSMLDGSFKRTWHRRPDRNGPNGRIKFGTESNGGFKNITISNCVFDFCRGLALETVDGGLLEDVTIDNITMRDVTSAALFLRLGARARGPGDPPPGELRRVTISNVIAYNVDPKYSSIISGIPGHDIEDIRLHNIRIYYRGGAPAELASTQPAEKERTYPEPSMFGPLPAYGFYIRHARNVVVNDVEVSYINPDHRPPFVLEDVKGILFRDVRAPHETGVPMFDLTDVEDLRTHRVEGIDDMKIPAVARETF